MKISKKVVVSSLSTAAALSFVAALSGTLAWFQYNTRVSTTVIGTGVAETGALQIKVEGGEWKRDLITAELLNDKHVDLKPVTFGAFEGALPAKAYMKPDASENWAENPDPAHYDENAHNPGSYADVYQEATANEDYIQYSVYIRAMEVYNGAGGEQKAAKDVYLSNILFADIDGAIASGLRAHLAIDSDGNGSADKYYLLSKDGVENLKLSGALDLDGDGIADREQGPEWNATRDNMVIYGNEGEFQSTMAASDLQVARVNNSIDGKDPENMKKKLFTTLTGANDVKVTVTLWLEGWDTSIGEREVDATELLYQEATYLKAVSVVEDYFQKDGNNYVKEAAAAKAVDSKVYYDVEASEITSVAVDEDFEDENVFEKVGNDYNKSADTYRHSGKTYYALVAKTVDNLVYPAALTAELATKYVDDANGNKIECTDDAEHFGDHAHYYILANNNVVYEAVTLEDREGNPIGHEEVSVEGLYTKDGNNYLAAHGLNQDGTQYYRFKSAGKIAGVPMWSGENTDGAQFRFGLTFDVGADAFEK